MMLLCDVAGARWLESHPRIRILRHMDTLPEFVVDRDISGAMTKTLKISQNRNSILTILQFEGSVTGKIRIDQTNSNEL